MAAGETCVIAAVADLPITIRAVADEADVPQGDPCVFDGRLVVADGHLAVADLVGDGVERRFRVTPGEVRVRLFADGPREARRLTVLVGAELVEVEAPVRSLLTARRFLGPIGTLTRVSQPPFEPPPPGSGHPSPPYPPGPPGPPFPPGPQVPQVPPPAPKKNRRPLTIVLIIVGVVAALCLGVGCVGLVAYYWSEVRTDRGGSEPVSGGPSSSPGASQPLSCGGAVQPARPETKAVGLPNFDAAARTGTATMQMTTNLGSIGITMDRARTPCTVASFQHLAEKKFFDGSTCHRLVTEGIFVLQCGDPSGTGTGGPDYQFGDENLSGAKYGRGVVAMANTGSPGTNSSQFFIIFKDSSTALQPIYTPFGTVSTGLDIVDRVAAGGHDNSSPGGGGVPKLGVTIETLTVS